MLQAMPPYLQASLSLGWTSRLPHTPSLTPTGTMDALLVPLFCMFLPLQGNHDTDHSPSSAYPTLGYTYTSPRSIYLIRQFPSPSTTYSCPPRSQG